MLEKTLESPLNCKEFKPFSPKGDLQYLLEGLMMKLKLQYFGYLMQRADSFEKTLVLGKIEGRRRRGRQRRKWLNGIIDTMDMILGKLWETVKDEKPGVLQSMGFQRTGHDLATEQQHFYYYVSHEMSVYFLLSYENTVVQFFPYLVSLSQYIEKKLQKLFSLQLKKSNNLFSLLSLKQLQFVLFDLSAVLSRFSRVQLVATPWTVAHQAALSMEFPRQEYWSGLPFSSPGELPDPGIEPMSLMSPAFAEGLLTTSATSHRPTTSLSEPSALLFRVGSHFPESYVFIIQDLFFL